jgi:hypothetical protein
MSSPAHSPSRPSSSGVDLPTLAITAIASATAAYVCSQIWARGTLASAAVTPVLVALIKEALSRPAQVVTQAVPLRGTVRSATHPDEPHAPVAERVPQQGEVRGRSRLGRGPAWKTAIVTGVLGFLVGAVIITVPELVAGQSAAGGGRETTFFGGEQEPTTTTPTDTTTTTTPAETITVPPAETVTLPPANTVTVPPEQTTTAPTTTEPPLPTDPEAEPTSPAPPDSVPPP